MVSDAEARSVNGVTAGGFDPPVGSTGVVAAGFGASVLVTGMTAAAAVAGETGAVTVAGATLVTVAGATLVTVAGATAAGVALTALFAATDATAPAALLSLRTYPESTVLRRDASCDFRAGNNWTRGRWAAGTKYRVVTPPRAFVVTVTFFAGTVDRVVNMLGTCVRISPAMALATARTFHGRSGKSANPSYSAATTRVSNLVCAGGQYW